MKKVLYVLTFVLFAVVLLATKTQNEKKCVLSSNIEALTSGDEPKKYTYRECYVSASNQFSTGRVCNNSTDTSIKALDFFTLEYIDQLFDIFRGRDDVLSGTYPCLSVGYVQLVPIMHGLCYSKNF